MLTQNLRQNVRQLLVNGSIPLRYAGLPLAKPTRLDLGESVIWNKLERGTYDQVLPPFGSIVPSLRPYHVSTEVISNDQAAISFSNEHAFDENGRILYEKNLPFVSLPIALERLDRPTQTRPLVTYLSNTWATNFYHWMCLTLPLLRFYEAAGVPIGEVYVGKKLSGWQQRSLELIGISSDSVVTEPCRAEVANVAVSTRSGGAIAPEGVSWVRDKLLGSEPGPGHRRLFVSRGQTTTRRLLDEENIASALVDQFGFEFVSTSNMTLDEEIALFGEADVVVGAYGAAFTNLLFAPRGTRVLELRAFDADFAAKSAFVELSCILGNMHGALIGLPTSPGGRAISTDVKVDVDEVLRAVESMLEVGETAS